MNIAFYVESIQGKEGNSEIFDMLNDSLESKEISNGSVFYDNIEYNPVEPKFGMFNATDLWFFTGSLITTSWETYLSTKNVINKFTHQFLFTKNSKVNVFCLNEIADNVRIITTNKEDSDYVKRVTGKPSAMIDQLNIKSLKEVL
jgi:hypothetical protein